MQLCRIFDTHDGTMHPILGKDERKAKLGARVEAELSCQCIKGRDELGGIEAALRKARSLAGLDDETPAREVRAPRKPVPPRALPTAASLVAYMLEGIALLSRASALTVMEVFAPEVY